MAPKIMFVALFSISLFGGNGPCAIRLDLALALIAFLCRLQCTLSCRFRLDLDGCLLQRLVENIVT